MAAETLGVPLVTGALGADPIPSDYRPPPGLPNLGRWANRLIWRLGYSHSKCADKLQLDSGDRRDVAFNQCGFWHGICQLDCDGGCKQFRGGSSRSFGYRWQGVDRG